MRATVLFLLALTLLLPVIPAAAQTDQRCFSETGNCIAGPIRAYWERGGGLSVFGYPITAQAVELIEGQSLQVQWFERDRLEIQADGRVTTGRLGVERLAQVGTPWQPGPNAPAGVGCTAFTETGYQICGAFVSYWQKGGGLERFGLPVTDAFQTTLEGQSYMVQYFERRRFELHPEITADTVLLGLLGREVLSARQGQPETPNTQPTPVPQPAAPSYNNCQDDPNSASAPNYPVKITAINKGDEVVTLQNLSPETVNLDGWIMCSIKGNQQHPIRGSLAPGESKDFPGVGGPIWNNSDIDNGALYDHQGRLISYWNDR